MKNPAERLTGWLEAATETEPNDANAMAVSSVGPDGRPSCRMVLLKGLDERGLVFYTNFESRKGRELLAKSYAAALFHWKSQRRQVRIEGRVETVSDAEADAYFASRSRLSQLAAAASEQSRPLRDRSDYETAVSSLEASLRAGGEERPVPRPAHWSGFRILPDRFEFWQDGVGRMHDRDEYLLRSGVWEVQKLYP